MDFSVEDTEIPEVKIIHGKRFHDDRGYFSQLFKANDLKALGLPEFVQDNMSVSGKGVIRGMHWQEAPYAQGKLVTCLSGSIFDVALDIRPDSKTFGKHVAIHLESTQSKWLWIPAGFAHGFQSLESNSLVLYKVSEYWVKNSEQSVNPVSFGFQWPLLFAKLSEKDSTAKDFAELGDCL